MLTRRSFLVASGAAAGTVCGVAPGAGGFGAGASVGGVGARHGVAWHDVAEWGVQGKGWVGTERFFDRLPASGKGVVPDAVWNLSRQSAGMSAEFSTDATEISVRYSLLSDRIAMPHMPATGVSGIDLYGRDGDRWRWAAVYRPGGQENEGTLISRIDEGHRSWRVYLPLYNGVTALAIGVPEGAVFRPIAPRTDRPIVFYGTSILHGACSSRPGMAWPSIVGRRLDRPTLNLGFSGNGRMEIEVAELLAEVDGAAYVVDCAPNMSAGQIRDRAGALVETIRAARPGAPIVLVEDRSYGYGWVRRSARERNAGNRKALGEVYRGLVADGVLGLHYVGGATLLGDMHEEAMTDGSHPSDLGMWAYADALTPVLQRAMGSG